MKTFIVSATVLFILIQYINCKKFKRNELALLLSQQGIPANQILTLACIARHESGYNTSVISNVQVDGSRNHGLFQFSDKTWCTRTGPPGLLCNMTCAALHDDDITDDIECLKTVFAKYTELEDDGYKAWPVSYPKCSHIMVYLYYNFKDIFLNSIHSLYHKFDNSKIQS